MRWVFLTAAVLACAACAASPGQMRRSPTAGDLQGYQGFSWGRAGVSYEDYDEAAFECTARGVTAATGLRTGDVNVAGASADPANDDLIFVINRTLMLAETQARDAHLQRQQAVDACLTEFGFRRYGLNTEQLGVLDGLARGSEARRRYLHGLGSGPAILSAQGL